jgi:3-phosphoshikimate 1-carboxyvinyltransferase
MRLMAGILAGQRFGTTLDGSEQLRKRPMRRITGPLSQMGANINATDGRAPLRIEPASLQGIRYEMPVASAQVKSAILLAGLYAGGDVSVCQPGPARDHTERMLAAMGVPLHEAEGWITLPFVKERSLAPLEMRVPADISSAAFLLVAACIVPHSKVTLTAIGMNETRTGIVEMLAQMGAQVARGNDATSGGEPVADLSVTFDEMHAAEIGGEVVVRGIDEFPILTVAATQAAGTTVVSDAAELRVKEVDRISMLAGEMRKMGAEMIEKADGFTLEGPIRLRGAVVDSHDDHRLGMALAVAALAADSPSTILNARCIADSFPGFVEVMNQLGAEIAWVD